MKGFLVFVPISALFFLAGHLDAQTFQNSHQIPVSQNPISVFSSPYSGNPHPLAKTATVNEQVLGASTSGSGIGDWTWMGGSSTLNSLFGTTGVYGTLGTPAPGNIPGGRQYASTWTDGSGHLWLFGGGGVYTNGDLDFLNDLWEFNPSTNEWAWISGSSTITCGASVCGQPGNYGTLGKPAAGNVPGGRQGPVSWIDSNGNLWLFAGYGFDASGNLGVLNDLWEFNSTTVQWTWMGGSSEVNQPGVYGTLGAFAAGNIPAGRQKAASWIDSGGNLWLFGGSVAADGNSSVLNDLWEFNPSRNQWAWMGGSSTLNQFGVGGVLGTPAAGNIPGSRFGAAVWTDSQGVFWLFGGWGYAADGFSLLNDLWEFNASTGEWAWMGGSDKADQFGNYGALAIPAAGNIPGSRYTASNWIDLDGNLWLMGGYGFGVSGVDYSLNDLWKLNLDTSQWAWMSGGDTTGQPGVYGTLGIPAVGNTPGSRYGGLNWTDNQGNFWLFGGLGLDADGAQGELNDLWEYQPSLNSLIATTTVLQSSATSLTFGQTLTLTAAVTPASGAAPTGTVTFNNGAVSLGTANLDSRGVATLALTPAVGTYSITASYAGSATDEPSVSSPPINVTVAGVASIATTTTLTSSATTLTAGQSVTLTATVTVATGSTPGGFVTFLNGATSLGTVVLQPSGTATLALTPLAGTYSITASYAAYESWQASVSSAVEITVTGMTTNSPNIYTYAGDGTQGFSGDNGLALNAELWWPAGEGMDSAGNLYFADIVNSRIRKVDASTGIITTVAGNGEIGFGGDGGPALGASFSSPQGVALDKAGNIYVADELNNRVRRIDASTGIITTIAGTGTPGSSRNGGPAVAAELYAPSGVAIDSAGDVYISNLQNNLIQKVNATTGTISTVAGTGGSRYNGDGIPATSATVWSPYGVGLDTAGNLYIMDGGNYRVRRVDATTGMITTVAGNGANGFSGDGGPATGASISSPAGDIVFDSAGNLYFEDTENNRVRRVDAVTGTITTFAGDGEATYGGDGGPANLAQIQSPSGLVFDSGGNLYIGDTFNQRIRRVGAPLTTPSIATTTTLIASATTLTFGQTLTLTATVTPASGATPTGTVTFNNGAASLGSANLNSSDVATLTLAPAVGNYSITASYGGSTNDAASTSAPVAVNVSAAPTTTALTASLNPAPFGATVTFTATVESSTDTPGGSVSFYDGATLLTTATLSSGVASYSTSALSVGSHNISADYAGSTGFSSASNIVVEVIFSADFSISALPAARTVYTGEAATYIVTIAPGTGFNLPVALSCSQLPVNTTCTFSPATVSGGSESSTLTVQTTAPSKVTIASRWSTKVGVPILAGLFLLFIPRRFRRYRKSGFIFLALLVCIVLGAAITGCGGPGPLTGGTPVGAQTVTVTGTATNGSQTLTHATTVTLNVKSLF